ncbi:MAG: PAC2 family protein [candidate division WOR-3 bacterium]
MRVGAFEVAEPVPSLRDPYALAILKPWIDVNNVGTLVLKELEARFQAGELARLVKPGHFFDFSRYRPTVHLEQGIREISIPNLTVNYARREGAHDLLFLHLLEPHALAEAYVDSVLKLLKAFKVSKYILLGSMYDAVPHTRPLILNGWASGGEAQGELKRSGAFRSMYQGPTTITILIAQKAQQFNIQSLSFIVSLPQYVVLEEDYLGKLRLMEALNLLYDIPIDGKNFEKALEQRTAINERVERSPEVKSLLPQLETLYDLRIKTAEAEGIPKLTSEMEEIFWKTMGKDEGEA